MNFKIKNTTDWMIKNFDLISIILATCLTWLSRLDLSKSLILKEPLIPKSIFESIFVKDFPNGNLSEALNMFSKSDLILIYVYSHWDAESVSYKAEIVQLATAFHYKIPVVAVNCWSNTSNCFNSIKPNRFPKLYAYISSYLLVEYKDSIESNKIFSFVNSLIYPFHFPKTNKELENLNKMYDATFIFCIDSQSSSFTKSVRIFHQVSSLYKGKDTNYPNIGFIILSETDESFVDFRRKINLTKNEAILYSFTGINIKYTGKFTPQAILQFINLSAIKPTVNKYSPSGTKSLNSQEILRRGVLLLLIYNGKNRFLWNNLKARYDFQAIALQTKKCSSKLDWTVSIVDLLQFKKEIVIETYLENQREYLACQQYYKTNMFDFTVDILNVPSSKNINQSKHFFDYEADPFVKYSQLKTLDWICRKHSLSANLYNNNINTPPSFDDTYQPFCHDKYNRSIQFAEVDGSKYGKLLENWGVLLSDNETLPRVIVIDWKNEIIHHMKSEINQIALNNLIAQISMNNLSMFMNSIGNHFVKSLSSSQQHEQRKHFYPIDVFGLEQELQDPYTDLVVFYYTPWCPYCSSLANLLIMLSRYFANYPMIHFTSLNTFTNDLPCKYQSERVPALIIYPRGRKSESIVFHITDENISLSSLVKFILENSGDQNLNLNAPSIDDHQNNNNNNNIKCDINCLKSAKETVGELHRRFTVTMNNIIVKIKIIQSKLREVCTLPQFVTFQLRLYLSRDWSDYYNRHTRLKYQSQLIIDLNSLFWKRDLLSEKLLKLSKINKGIGNIIGDISLKKKKTMTVTMMKSVELTAEEILKNL